MYKRDTAKGAAIIIFAVVMMITLLLVMTEGKANAKTPKGRLVKSVICQYYDKDTKKWEKSYILQFKYNKKKDPGVITKKYYLDGEVVEIEKWISKYTYKNKKRRTRTIKVPGDSKTTIRKWTYDRYGKPAKYVYRGGTGGTQITSDWKTVFTKSGYLKTEIRKEKMDEDTEQFAYKYKTSLKNGLPMKMTVFEKKDSSLKKLFNYTFNKKGFISKSRNSGNAYYRTVKYVMKNGRVTSAPKTYKGDLKNEVKYKYKFSYTKKTAKKKRYAKMINYLIEDGDGRDENMQFAWY